MGIFGDLDIASAVDPFEIPDGTYKAVTGGTKVKKGEKNGKETFGLTFTYTIDDEESKYNGRKAGEYKRIPSKDDDTYDKDLGYLKQRLASLGVPESRMNDVEPEELDDIPVVITVKNNVVNGQNYVNVQRVALREDSSVGAVNGANPFA